MTQNTTTNNGGLHDLLSGFEATMLLEGHGLPTWEGADVDVLTTDAGGQMLFDMMRTAIFQLRESIDGVQRGSVRLAAKNTELAEAVGNGLHADVTWVEQASRDLVQAVRRRDAAIEGYRQAALVARRLVEARTQD
jgi:hypothetical protein